MFRDRVDAAERLVPALMHLKGQAPTVLALPRGGVPIGAVLAKALDAPLDILLVRTIGVPGQPELAAGAVVDGESAETVLNDDVVRLLDISDQYIEDETRRQLAEIERRRGIYLHGRARSHVAGRTAIVVDDGIATGATVRAALHAARRGNPQRLVLAVPVAAADTMAALRPLVDEAICLKIPTLLGAISGFYLRFPQVTDGEVEATLRQYPAEPSPEQTTQTANG